jgi:hypothetical protein
MQRGERAPDFDSRTKPVIRVGSASCSAQGRLCFSSTLAR